MTKIQQKPCTWRATMYRYSNGQISLADFKQPVGMNLGVVHFKCSRKFPKNLLN